MTDDLGVDVPDDTPIMLAQLLLLLDPESGYRPGKAEVEWVRRRFASAVSMLDATPDQLRDAAIRLVR